MAVTHPSRPAYVHKGRVRTTPVPARGRRRPRRRRPGVAIKVPTCNVSKDSTETSQPAHRPPPFVARPAASMAAFNDGGAVMRAAVYRNTTPKPRLSERLPTRAVTRHPPARAYDGSIAQRVGLASVSPATVHCEHVARSPSVDLPLSAGKARMAYRDGTKNPELQARLDAVDAAARASRSRRKPEE